MLPTEPPVAEALPPFATTLVLFDAEDAEFDVLFDAEFAVLLDFDFEVDAGVLGAGGATGTVSHS